MNIIEIFKQFSLLGATWVMWVLVVLSVISIAIMIERTIFFTGQRPRLEPILARLREHLSSGDFDEAQKALENERGVAAAVSRVALAEAKRGPEAADEAAAGALIGEKMRLERNLAFLGTVGNNAPFVGLFGTVIGIIVAFHDLSLNTQGGASTVMAGISEALVATAIGLLVALPAVAAFNLFQRRIKAVLADADIAVHVILSGLRGNEHTKGR